MAHIIDNTYSIRWYGPFKSVEEVKVFEEENLPTRFQLYLLQGNKPYNKYRDSYYCGQTKRSVYQRLTDEGHHINEFKTISGIWIGSISNVEPCSDDINFTENVITAHIRSIEGEKNILNKINDKFPKRNAYIVNIWHSVQKKRYQKYAKYSIPDELPDLIGHEYDKDLDKHFIFGAPRIKWVGEE